jgi:hypothetical protein
LLAPLGLHRALPWFMQAVRMVKGPKGQQPAE